MTRVLSLPKKIHLSYFCNDLEQKPRGRGYGMKRKDKKKSLGSGGRGIYIEWRWHAVKNGKEDRLLSPPQKARDQKLAGRFCVAG